MSLLSGVGDRRVGGRSVGCRVRREPSRHGRRSRTGAAAVLMTRLDIVSVPGAAFRGATGPVPVIPVGVGRSFVPTEWPQCLQTLTASAEPDDVVGRGSVEVRFGKIFTVFETNIFSGFWCCCWDVEGLDLASSRLNRLLFSSFHLELPPPLPLFGMVCAATCCCCCWWRQLHCPLPSCPKLFSSGDLARTSGLRLTGPATVADCLCILPESMVLAPVTAAVRRGFGMGLDGISQTYSYSFPSSAFPQAIPFPPPPPPPPLLMVPPLDEAGIRAFCSKAVFLAYTLAASYPPSEFSGFMSRMCRPCPVNPIPRRLQRNMQILL